MDKIQRLFLRTLSCALKKEYLSEAPSLSPEEWDAFFRLAQEQKVLPLVFETLCRLPEVRELPLFLPLKRHVVGQVMLQTRKTAEFRRVLNALLAAGLKPLVVKGLVCRSLYPLPDHRPSSDEDLLIPRSQFQKCHEVLTGLGLTTDGDPGSSDYELPYRQPEGPLFIELHRSLFPPESEAYGSLNRFFTDAHRNSLMIDGVPTLAHTDHLFYLICHAFKHFLHSGFGIRQVCDILLFGEAYRENIQWDLLRKNCRSIRADKFAAAIFAMGRKHLGIDIGFFDTSVDEMPMLLDLLDSGIYGGATMSRAHSSNITLKAVSAGKKSRSNANSLLASLFPDAGALEGRYSYLKKYPWLLPAAWTSRMAGYLRETRSRNSPTEALKIGNSRIELLKYYNILT